MKKQPIFILFILLLIVLFVSTGCLANLKVQRADEANRSQNISDVSQPGKAGEIKSDYESEEKGCVRYDAPDGAMGIARYYAKRYNGRKTSSGQIHNPKAMTAEHPDIPLGTRVKVINPANHKLVIVRINDRCREQEEPFIDLSREAARKLGIIRKGKANVRMIILEDDDSPSDNPAAEKNSH
jgi:rare lipoprotein A